MASKFPGQRRPAEDAAHPAQRRDAGDARLWHIGVALAVSFTVAVAALAGLAGLAWLLLGAGGFRRHGAPPLHDTVAVAQLVFASVAGAGALVALVVAYRRQKVAEADSAHDRALVLNERFTAIAAQLGDAQPAVRLAGVHAMAGLADDWRANRQTCIDVLCAYLRMPYESDPGEAAAAAERLAFRAGREVRHTVIRVITAHLQPGAAVSWQGCNFDFTGVIFDGGTFTGVVFSGGTVAFSHAKFSGAVDFMGAVFSGGRVGFISAEFSGGQVRFMSAKFSGGPVDFGGAVFSGGTVGFGGAKFSGGTVNFRAAVSQVARWTSPRRRTGRTRRSCPPGRRTLSGYPRPQPRSRANRPRPGGAVITGNPSYSGVTSSPRRWPARPGLCGHRE